MTKEQLAIFQSKIQERLKQIDEAVETFKTDLVDYTQNQTNFLQDGIDHAQELSDMAARIEIHERNMVSRKQLRDALEKIRLGTFGECEECGKTIDPRRMEALPTAICCVSCKTSIAEQNKLRTNGDVAWIIPEQLFGLYVPRGAA